MLCHPLLSSSSPHSFSFSSQLPHRCVFIFTFEIDSKRSRMGRTGRVRAQVIGHSASKFKCRFKYIITLVGPYTFMFLVRMRNKMRDLLFISTRYPSPPTFLDQNGRKKKQDTFLCLARGAEGERTENPRVECNISLQNRVPRLGENRRRERKNTTPMSKCSRSFGQQHMG